MKKTNRIWGIVILGWILAICIPSVCGNRQQTRGQRVQSATATRKVALVIGNAEYQATGKLKNPVNDAKAMARTLNQLGFDVLTATDCSKQRMEELVSEFGQRLRDGGSETVGLFYYAGHGMQIKGVNYLIPVEAQIKSEADVRYRSMEVDYVLGQMEDAGNRVNLVILDACRDNPYGRGFRSSQQGLAQVNAPKGTLIAYATAPGKTASDGTGDNGLYTAELLKAIQTPGLSVLDVFTEVGAQVDKRSNGQQTPWQSSSLTGRYYFVNGESGTQPDDRLSPAGASADRETSFWNSIQSSTDVEDYRAYLKKYPNGEFADLARNRINRMENGGRPNPGGGSSASRPPVAPAPARQMTNRLGMEFVLIPEGSFEMGSNNGEADEKPVHRVTITKPYYLGKYEVTQGQWEAVMGSNPSDFKGANLPVEIVSWEDCQEFIKKLNARGDGEYRLPSEAEWEYACRAGTTGDYAGSLDAMGWYYENSGDKRLQGAKINLEDLRTNKCRTHPVGQKQPNGWGLYDMYGNVFEWCQDWYEDGYYGKNPESDPTGPTKGSYRVIRGGGWHLTAPYCRSAHRYRNTPDYRSNLLGFRLVRAAL